MQLVMLWVFGFVHRAAGQRATERRASCGDGPTHRGIPGDHLVGIPFGGWGLVGRHLQRHPGWRLAECRGTLRACATAWAWAQAEAEAHAEAAISA